MNKILLLVFCSLPLLGTSCPVPSIGVTCSNDLDASSFGFTLTISPGFTCITTEPNSALLVSVRYRNASNGFIAAVTLAPPSPTDGCGGEPICSEQNPLMTPNGVTFRMFRVASTNPAFTTYLGITTLPSGNNLGISVSILSSTNEPALLANLTAILNSVNLT